MSKTNVTAWGVLLLVMILGAAPAVSAQEVQLSMANGRVTLVAKDATVQQILAEWARVGDTRILNIEKIPGGPVTLELINVSEDDALDVLLRSVSGYMTAPRPTAVATLSRYDRILVLPTSATPPRAAVAAAPAPVRQQPQPLLPQPADFEPAADEPSPTGAVPARGPVFTAFPQPQIINPQPGAVGGAPQPQVGGQAPPAGSPRPASPVGGVAVPGMIVQPPVPAGQQPGAQTPQR